MMLYFDALFNNKVSISGYTIPGAISLGIVAIVWGVASFLECCGSKYVHLIKLSSFFKFLYKLLFIMFSHFFKLLNLTLRSSRTENEVTEALLQTQKKDTSISKGHGTFSSSAAASNVITNDIESNQKTDNKNPSLEMSKFVHLF